MPTTFKEETPTWDEFAEWIELSVEAERLLTSIRIQFPVKGELGIVALNEDGQLLAGGRRDVGRLPSEIPIIRASVASVFYSSGDWPLALADALSRLERVVISSDEEEPE